MRLFSRQLRRLVIGPSFFDRVKILLDRRLVQKAVGRTLLKDLISDAWIVSRIVSRSFRSFWKVERGGESMDGYRRLSSLLCSALSWRRLTFIQLNLSRQPLFNGRISRPMGRDAASVDNWTFQWLAATSNNGIRTRIHLISRNRGRWWHEGYRDWRFRRDETSSLYTDSSVWKAWIRDGFCGRWMM